MTPSIPTRVTRRYGAAALAGAILAAPAVSVSQAQSIPIATLRPVATSPSDSLPSPPQQGPVNPRLLPDISIVGDIVGDLSPDGSTQEDGSRFGVREAELALQAAVDPYFRGDVFLGFSDAEGVHIEQAYLTAMSLPWQLEMRAGRYLLPFTKQNTTHRHDLHTVEFPHVIQRFLGEEGLKGTGLWASRILSPFGFFQEVLLTANDRFGETPEDLTTESPVNEDLDGLTYSARLRNYWDLSRAANVELSGSVLTSMREQPVTGADNDVTAAAARQTLFGVDLTYRWRPPERGLYRSFIFQAEFLRQQNRTPGALPPAAPGEVVVFEGPTRSFNGGYAFARYQVSRRAYLAARFDTLEDPEFGGERTRAVSGYYTFLPSEFSKLVAAFERLTPGGQSGINRILLQATFALGPHRPHPF
jgi:hypothetical protein